MCKFAAVGLLCAVLGAWGCQDLWVPQAGRPTWVDEPARPESQGEFLSVIGIAAAGQDAEAAAAVADLNARNDLRDAVSDYTRNAVAGFFAANRQYPLPSSPLSGELVDILRTEVAANILRLATRERTWQAPDGRTYVFYRVPLTLVNAEISQCVRDAVVYVNPFGTGADRAVVELDGYLVAFLSERLTATTRGRPATETTPPEQRVPAWLQAGYHKDYPVTKFHAAIGLGKDLPAAEASARGELAFRLSAQLERLLTRLPAVPAAAPLVAGLKWLDPAALSFTEADLAIARIAERWHDPVTSTDYALAVLDPSTAVLILRDKITTARDSAQDLLASARNHQRAENCAVSLREYGEAVAAAGQAIVIQAKAAAIAPRAIDEIMGLVTEPLLDQACQGVRSLLAGFRMEGVEGDLQWMLQGRPPTQAFAVKVSAGEPAGPARNIPVRFVQRDTGRLLGGTPTDAGGVARYAMTTPLPNEPPNGAVVAQIDLEAAGLPVKAARLSAPQVEFAYAMRSTANTRLVLLVQESTDAGRSPAASIARALEDALMRAGFQFVSREDLAQRMPAADLTPDSDDKAIRGAFASLREAQGPYRCLLVVIGEFRPHVAETSPVSEGELFFARCPWRFRAVDSDLPGEQHTVLDISGTAAAAFLGDSKEALKRARAEGEQQATAQVIEALRARFGES